MSINPRKLKFLKKKFVVYIFLLGILICIFFFLNTLFVLRKPLFTSPMGKVNTDLVHAEKILKDKNILFSRIISSDDSYLVDIQNNGQVRLSQNKDIYKQISSLQRILIQLTIEGKSFKSIDFRFSEPIISF